MHRLFVIALVAVATGASAEEFPKLKAGLWSTTMTSVNNQQQPARVSTLCLDESVQQEMYKMSTGMMSGMCGKHDLKISGNKVTTQADCTLGTIKMQSSSVMVFTGNTAYHTEAHSKFDPPMNGMSESNTVIDGKYIGACKPGQQPGDMTLPDGRTMNIRQMMGRK